MRMVSLRKPWPRRLFPNSKRNLHDTHSTTPIIPRKTHRFLRLDSSDSQRVTGLVVALVGLVPKSRPFPWSSSWALSPGYSFLYGTWVAYNPALFEDGTDRWHLPGSDYKYRIWAGGEIHFRRSGEPLLLNDVNHSIATVQETKDIRYKDGARVAFVKIKRITLRVQSDTKSTPEKLERFSKVEPEDLDNPPDNLDPHVIEYRWLIFSKDPPGPAMIKADTKMPLCPGKDDYHLIIIPNAALLFQFSALTNNAHAIHLDSEYAKNVYGLPAKVVQGPLATHLMLQILHHSLRLRENKVGLVRGQLRVASLKYTNIAPLYVDEEMKISCRKVDGDDGAKDWQTWDVWVSKKSGPDAVWKVAVRGVARVNVLPKVTAMEDRRKVAAPKDQSGRHAQSKDEETERGKVEYKSVTILSEDGGVVEDSGDVVRGRISKDSFWGDGSMIEAQDGRARRRGYLRLPVQHQQTDQTGMEWVSVINDSLEGWQRRQNGKEEASARRAWELWDDESQLERESKEGKVAMGAEDRQWERKAVMDSEVEPALVSNMADFDEVDLAVDRLLEHYEGLRKRQSRDVGAERESERDGEV